MSKLLKSIGLIFLILFLATSLSVLAQEKTESIKEVILDENIQPKDLGVNEPRILPDSPIYFLKDWSRSIRSFLTFNEVDKAELKLKELKTGKLNTIKEATNLLAGIVYNNIRKFSVIPGITHFIVGGRDDSGFHLYDLGPDGSITEMDDYVSSGSGSMYVYGVLEGDYKQGLDIKAGIDLAVKGINSSIHRDIASGNGVMVYTITDKGVKKVLEKELNFKLEV